MKSKPNLKQITLVLFLSAFIFSCAPKKSSGVRAQVKSSQTNLNPAVSSAAEQQATLQNAVYKINTVSLPNLTGAGFTVNSELIDPSNQYLPVTTSHENGALDSQGVFTDSTRGLQVYVNARCSSDECFKYLLLVTVVRNNQAIFQTGAISYKNDCRFKSVSMGTNVGQMFQNMNDFESRYSNVMPDNDSESCLQ